MSNTRYIESISFNRDIVLETIRQKHLAMFQVKKRTVTETDHRRPIYDPKISHRRIGYEKYKRKFNEFKLFEKGLRIEFSDITIIVGDNGSGKSSLLKYLKPPLQTDLLDTNDEDVMRRKHDIIRNWLKNDNVSIELSSSKPQYIIVEQGIHKTHFIDNIGKGKMFMSPGDIAYRWEMHDYSNGETTIDFITSLNDIENCVLVLDEPETSLSIKSQRRLADTIKHISTKNQVILVTHSPEFMRLSKTVYDFETKQYVKTLDYINDQYR